MATLAPTERTRQGHVLLVDDCTLMRAIYRRFLEGDGYRVSVAEDGPAALAALEREVPDLILLDHMMPGMSGAEVLGRIRSTPALAEIPTVFLTASALEVARAFDLGATDYFTKPIERRMLLARVRALIGCHAGARARQGEQSLERRLDHLRDQLRGARSVQRAQLPQMPARSGAFVITGAVSPCDEVGGDTFDLLHGPAGELTLALVDVSGHGFAAAMVASGIQGMLRFLAEEHAPARAMSELNRLLCAGTDEHYACVALVRVEGEVVHVVNAGLPPVLVIEGGEVVWSAEGCGFPPGMLPEAEYEQRSFTLAPGMRLILASDGLIEPFGHEQPRPVFLDALGLRGARLSEEEIRPATLSFRMGRLFVDAGLNQDDDATVVILEHATQAS
jgi:CheY-like chemotaxis protein